jgi:hypothetical protein
MLKLDTIADLQALHTNLVQESSTLEYKASPAIENTIERKREMAKDISAMANAEGGQFVYGMTEHNHQPAGLDAGMNSNPFNGLWFEQVIQQNVQPPIEGLKILQIPVGGGSVVTVITVPQSRTIHQIKDGRYYRRRNFRNDVMEDYEIREAFNRTTKPDLFLRISLAVAPTILTLPDEPSDVSMPFKIFASIGNKSPQPSFYTVIHLFADLRLQGGPPGFEPGSPATTNTGVAVSRWISKMGIPGSFPIFNETEFSVFSGPWQLTIPSALIDNHEQFVVGYLVTAPGFTGLQFGYLNLHNRLMTYVVNPQPS